ncbi:hypothetical protein GE21DRAFT_1077877 [Neurospora crassa]|nr:hypothetical protein GE21DRAFT_1077877 [Neurospora crassa]
MRAIEHAPIPRWSPMSTSTHTKIDKRFQHVSCLHLEDISHVEVHPTPQRTLSTRKSDTLTTSWHHRADSYAVHLRLTDPIMTGIQHKRPALSNISDSIAGFFLGTLFESAGRRACHGPPPFAAGQSKHGLTWSTCLTLLSSMSPEGRYRGISW